MARRASTLGVPCKLGEGGLHEVIEVDLTESESAALARSADHVRAVMATL